MRRKLVQVNASLGKGPVVDDGVGNEPFLCRIVV